MYMSEHASGSFEQLPKKEKTPVSELFKQYSELAVLRGEICDTLPDTTLEPGNDGTTGNGGEVAYSFDISLGGRDVPAVMREAGIDNMYISYTPEVMLDGMLDEKTVIVVLHETSGFSKIVTMRCPEDGDVKSTVSLELDGEREESPDISGADKRKVIDSMTADDGSLKELAGRDDGIGAYARKVLLFLEADGSIGLDDAELLALAAPEIEAATRRKS